MTTIDLNRHGIIEASAGTGKTYTIENLVPRIIEEKIPDISSIVVVTFTEKATGELKDRLRANLMARQQILSPGTTAYERIKTAIDNFENITISTIHGFCYKLLGEYAFENKGGFNSSIVDDLTLFVPLLAEQMRRTWKTVYGDHLEILLEVSGFSEKPESFRDTIITLASRYIPGYDRLYPAPTGRNTPEKIQAVLDSFAEKCAHLLELDTAAFGAFLDQALHKNSAKIITAYKTFINGCKNAGPGEYVLFFKRFYSSCKSSTAYKGSFDFLPDKVKKEYRDSADAALLPDICTLLDELTALFIPFSRQLLVNTVHALVKECMVYKKENNLISYNDMLLRLNQALDDPFLLDFLQKRFRFAILDEFQDTDMVQWEIFRKIFVDCETNPDPGARGNRLFIVGDPKQSIYRFRGADINTYLEAKTYLLERGAFLAELTTNYRSTSPLLDSLNHIFSASTWNFGTGITYRPVCVPGLEKLKTESGDSLNRKTFNVVDFGSVTGGRAKQLAADFIVREIGHLINNPGYYSLRTKKDAASRSLNESDIAVITRSRSQALEIENLLRRHRIKCTIYKKEGLYQSVEALHIHYLLSGLANPDDEGAFKKCLLTDFFALNLDDLDQFAEFDDSHQLRQEFLKWSELAARRNYSALFLSLLNCPGLIEGIKRRELEQGDDLERVITNYKHILENLEIFAQNGGLSTPALADHLQSLILGSKRDEKDENLHRLETEEKRVQILTIHASKGLEFPIVFLYGGFSSGGKSESYYSFHEGSGTLFDLSKTDINHKEKHESENEAEEKRLYYVAFTRAMCALYIPYFSPLKGGKQAPLVSFIKESVTEAKLVKRPPDSFYAEYSQDHFFSHEGPEQNGTGLGHEQADYKQIEECLQDRITGQIDRGYLKRTIRVTSFSALSVMAEHTGQSCSFGDSENKIQEKEEVSGDSGPDLAALTGLIPGGIYTGLMFHEVLEKIDYSLARSPAQLIDYFLAGHTEAEDRSICQTVHSYCDTVLKESRTQGPEEKREQDKQQLLESIADMIHKTLTVKLTDGIVLSKLKKKLHEVEFYLDFSSICTVPGYRARGFLTGIIDLVFVHNGRYYLADWKTNTLGGYSGPSFEKSVCDHYQLQMDIYYLAYIKWLKLYLKDFDYERDFGGILYLYLRGITGGQGIFFSRPPLSYYEDTSRSGMRFSLIEKIEGLML